MLGFYNRLLNKFPSLLGLGAILFWSTGSTAMSYLQALPPFQFLTFTFGITFVLAAVNLLRTGDWQSLKIPTKNWLIIIIGIPFHQIFYVFAYQNAPPAEVDLLIYLWPLMTLAFMAMLFNKKLTMRHFFAGLLGFSAILLLSAKDGMAGMSFAWGHIAAFFCALFWSLYTAFSESGPRLNFNSFGMASGVGFIVSLFCHLIQEQLHMPTAFEFAGMLYYLSFISILPILMWSRAIQTGSQVFLTTMAYFKPILSILLLISLGFAVLTLNLFLAATLVLIAGILSNDFLMEKTPWFSNKTSDIHVLHPSKDKENSVKEAA